MAYGLLLLPLLRRQVVLLGDGMDTRPFRLLWPAGTLIFSVAPAEVHEQAEAILAAAQPPAHVMRGCLLRRINMNLKPAIAAAAAAASAIAAPESAAGDNSQACATPINSSSNGGISISSHDGTTCVAGNVHQQYNGSGTVFREQLMRAGFRPDRLSVWVLQGLHNQGLGFEVLQQLLAEVADSAAFHRWVMLVAGLLLPQLHLNVIVRPHDSSHKAVACNMSLFLAVQFVAIASPNNTFSNSKQLL